MRILFLFLGAKVVKSQTENSKNDMIHDLFYIIMS